MPERKLEVTPRRTMQQIKHCVEEALAAFKAHEDPQHYLADLEQARQLLDVVIPVLKSRL